MIIRTALIICLLMENNPLLPLFSSEIAFKGYLSVTSGFIWEKNKFSPTSKINVPAMDKFLKVAFHA